MTHRHQHHRGGGRGCGPARGPFGMRSFNREEWLTRLEERIPNGPRAGPQPRPLPRW